MHLLALFLLAAPAATVTDTYPTGKGSVGFSLYLPGGTDQRLVGATYFFANDTALRIDFGLSAPIKGSGDTLLLTISTGLRVFAIKRERVGVFLQPAFAFGHEDSPAVAANSAWFVRFGAGVGAEYFFTNHFSVGAILEAALKFANIGSPGGTPLFITLATGTSSISGNVYF